MKPYRQIKRNSSRPFFRQRPRRLSGGAGLLLLAALLALLGAGFAFATVFRAELEATASQLLGTPRPTPTLAALPYAQRAIEHYQAGRLDDARADYERALAQRPQEIDYLYEYGRTLIDLEQYAEADSVGDRAVAAAPDDVRGYALKARALMWSDPAAAIPYAVTGLEIDPQFAPLHAALAVAYTNIGRYAEAYQRGLRATELGPLDAFSFSAFSIPLIYTGRQNEAIAALERAVAINPNLLSPYFELAAQYRAIQYQEMAVGIYRRILELDPLNAKAYLRVCQTYAEVGEFLEGTRFCETATEIDPSYAPAWQYLGQLQYNRRNYESALVSLENCVSFGSSAVECYYIRGLAYYFLGDCDKAWEVLTQSFEYTSEASIIDIINTGLGDIRANCPGFEQRRLPTPIPPTPIPPTPIGGI